MTASDPTRAIPAADRIADALADLADTLAGVRVLFERETERYEAERAADAERERNREPAMRESALSVLREVMTGLVHDAASGPGGEQAIADRLVEGLAKRAGTSWALRRALRNLGADNQPEDLRDVATRG